MTSCTIIIQYRHDSGRPVFRMPLSSWEDVGPWLAQNVNLTTGYISSIRAAYGKGALGSHTIWDSSWDDETRKRLAEPALLNLYLSQIKSATPVKAEIVKWCFNPDGTEDVIIKRDGKKFKLVNVVPVGVEMKTTVWEVRSYNNRSLRESGPSTVPFDNPENAEKFAAQLRADPEVFCVEVRKVEKIVDE